MIESPIFNIDEYDENIDNPEVFAKYELSANICKQCLNQLLNVTKPGMKYVDICKRGDEMIESMCKSFIEKKDKKYEIKKAGVSFPTCLCVNNIICNYSPLETETRTIEFGDTIRIDLGVHVDGYISHIGTTVFLPEQTSSQQQKNNQSNSFVLQPPVNKVKPFCSRMDKSRVLIACKSILEFTTRLMKPGMTNTQVGVITNKICEEFDVVFMKGIISHNVSRYVLNGNRVILHNPTPISQCFEHRFEPNEVYVIDIAVSSNPNSEGRSCEKDEKPVLFRREVNVNKMFLSNESSTRTRQFIDSKYDNFYFPLRHIYDMKGEMGMIELKHKGLVSALPVLHGKNNEIVCRMISTILVTEEKVIPLTIPSLQKEYLQGFQLKNGANGAPGFKNQQLNELMKTDLSF